MLDQLLDDEDFALDFDEARASDDPLVIRRILIDIARRQRKKDDLVKLRQAVTAEYDARIRYIEETIGHSRQAVQNYIERVNDGKPVSFPDVGTANVRKVGPAILVEDEKQFEEWAREMGYVREAVNVTAAKGAALKQALDTGEVVRGTVVEAPTTGLTVRFR
jgi:hypothetical protein